MKHHLVTLACGIGAVGCFVLGLGTGAIALFIAASILEATFWIRHRHQKLRHARAHDSAACS